MTTTTQTTTRIPQAITGLVPPELDEALIRETWQSVSAYYTPAAIARAAICSIVFAPLGWLILAPLKFKMLKGFIPGLSWLAVRFRLTNRRVMRMHGLKPEAVTETPLSAIDDVRIVTDANTEFFRAANLEIISQGKVVQTLHGVPEADTFCQAILNAARAWAPKPAPAEKKETPPAAT